MADDNFDEVAAFNSFIADCVLRPEEDREDKDDWADNYAEQHGVEAKRVKALTEIGIYSGERNEFNERHGKGEAKYPNGDVYTGDFVSTTRHGTGTYIHAQYSYEPTPFLAAFRRRWLATPEPREQACAEFAVALRTSVDHVVQVLHFVESTNSDFQPCYQGQWQAGKQHGEGSQLYRDGTFVTGNFADGARNGMCTVWYPNGDIYHGNLVKNVREGEGVYSYSDWTFSHAGAAAGAAAAAPFAGGSLNGTWADGRLVDGVLQLPDGTQWCGPFNTKSRPEVRKHFVSPVTAFHEG